MNMISTVGVNSSRVKRNYAFETVCFSQPSLAEAVCEWGAAAECELLRLTASEKEILRYGVPQQHLAARRCACL